MKTVGGLAGTGAMARTVQGQCQCSVWNSVICFVVCTVVGCMALMYYTADDWTAAGTGL